MTAKKGKGLESGTVTLDSICNRITDGTHLTPAFCDFGVPFLFVSNVIDGAIVFNKTKFISKEVYHDLNRRCPVEVGDVLFTIVGSYGNAAVVEDGRPFSFQRHIAHLKPDHSKVDSRYLRAALASPLVRRTVDSLVRGIAQKTLNLEQLKSITIPLPPLPEQRRFAAILDKADAIRRKREEGIRLTEALLPSTFQEMFGDPVKNERGWPRKEMSELLDNIDSGWSPKCHDRRAEGDEWAVLKLGAATYCKYQPEENKALPETELPQPHLEVKPGDLLMTRKNTYELVAACAFVYETPPRLMLPDLIFRLRIREQRQVRAEYLWGLLTHPGKRRGIQSLAGGSAGSMPNISKEKLLRQLIELPPAPLQDKFAEIMHGMHRMKKKRLELTVEQDALFSALVQRAFRGEL